ncbi:MAG TPA: TssN family type VI secretion system protein [Bacteroidia bacterium]|nr:TssN family type VI secretion system protein [Bacteroidia bacterium]
MLRSLFQSKANAAKSQALGGVQKAARKAYFKYALVFSLLLTLYAAFCFLDFGDILYFFIGFEVWAFILGIIHVWQMGRRFGWRNRYSFIEKLEMTLLIILFSMVFTALLIYFFPYSWVNAYDLSMKEYWFHIPWAILSFLLPLFSISVFDFAMAIPPEQYKKWLYPEKPEMPDLDRIDFTNSYILNFEIYKRANDRLPKILQFKAPLNNITFGDMFYMYLYEFNEAHRENPIEYADNNQKRYAWLFYIKPRHWWNEKKMIDPRLTISENKIKEKEIIVPFRADE